MLLVAMTSSGVLRWAPAVLLLLAVPVMAAIQEVHVNITHGPTGRGGGVLVPYTLYAPSAVSNGSLPLIFAFNGYSVEGKYYSEVAKKLARRGYVTVVSSYSHAAPGRPGLPRPGCPSGRYVVGSAALIDTLVKHARRQAKKDALMAAVADADIVTLGHAFGGVAALGAKNGMPNCPLMPSTTRRLACEFYNWHSTPARVKGALVYEAHLADAHLPDFAVPNGKFVAYASGAHDGGATRSAYDKTRGGQACITYVRLDKLSHYGITNYVEGDLSQTTACAEPHDDDPPGYSITPAAKSVQQELLVQTWDATIRSWLLKDPKATAFLKQAERELPRGVLRMLSKGCQR